MARRRSLISRTTWSASVGDRRHLQQGVADEGRPKASSLLIEIDAKPREDHDRHGIASCALGQPRWCRGMRDRASRESVVARHCARTIETDDVDPGGVRQRVTSAPVRDTLPAEVSP
jgi:hypothetical protein